MNVEKCPKHLTAIDSYCYDCQLKACSDCLAVHIKQKHTVKTITQIATDYKTILTQQKYLFEASIREVKKELETSKEDISSKTEKLHDKALDELKALEKSLTEKRIYSAIKLSNEFDKIMTSLSLIDSGKIYAEKLDELDKLIATGLFEELVKASSVNYLDIGKDKIKDINKLRDKIEIIKNENSKYINEMEELIQFTLDFKKFSKKKNLKKPDDKIANLQKLRDELSDSVAKKNRQSATNIEMQSQLELIKLELQAKKSDLQKLNERNKETEEKLNELQNKYQSDLIKQKEILSLDNKPNEVLINQSILAEEEKKKEMKVQEEIKKEEEAKKEPEKIPETPFEKQQDVIQSYFFHFYERAADNLYLYDVEKDQIIKIKVKENKFPLNHDSIHIKNSIYIAGGFFSKTMEFTSNTSKYELATESSMLYYKLANMHLGKSRNKLIALNLNTIYTLGGTNKNSKYLNECERYEIDKNRWETIAPLNEKKLNISACSFDCISIYAFGGFNNDVLNTIEVYTPSEDNRWNIVGLKSNKGWTARDEVACFQVTPNRIMILGGIAAHKKCTNQVLIFNPKEHTMDLGSMTLEKSEWFYGSHPVFFDKKIYCIGQNFKEIHVFDSESKNWTITVIQMNTDFLDISLTSQ